MFVCCHQYRRYNWAGKGRNRNIFESTGAKHFVTSRDKAHSALLSAPPPGGNGTAGWLCFCSDLFKDTFPKVQWICVEKLMELWDPNEVLRSYQGAISLSCYGSSKILHIEACFLIIVILNDIFYVTEAFLMPFYLFIGHKNYICLHHWVFNWELLTRKFGWNMSICFKALGETKPESRIPLALLPQDYQIWFPVLQPAGSVSCLWCSHL